MKELINLFSEFAGNRDNFVSNAVQNEAFDLLAKLRFEKEKQDELMIYVAKEAPELFNPL